MTKIHDFDKLLQLRESSYLRTILSRLFKTNLFLLNAFLRRSIGVKFISITALISIYLLYKAKKTKIKKVCKKNDMNVEILEHLEKNIREYKPTPYLPTAILQIIMGIQRIRYSFTLEKEVVTLPDGGELLMEWFPENFACMEPRTPIVIFNCGAAGSSTEPYCQEFCNLIKKRGWRMVVFNRRGFGPSDLKNTKFMWKDEVLDLKFAVKKINEIFVLAPLYMIGVSAGANFATNYIGFIGHKTPIKALVSISNPFNIGRISFNMRYSVMSKIFSKGIASSLKKLYQQHYKNPHFKNIIKNQFNLKTKIDKKMGSSDTTWKLDKHITAKFGGFDNVYDYYMNISSETRIESIKVPSLFISNQEDPICIKESVPIEKIYNNENTILLFAERGGHIEYFSGWNADWWAFITALDYFEYFEKFVDEKIAEC